MQKAVLSGTGERTRLAEICATGRVVHPVDVHPVRDAQAPWIKRHPVTLGSLGEFEMCPDRVPIVDNRQWRARIALRTISCPPVRSPGQLSRKSSKRVQGGEAIINSQSSRYLIDFIMGISDISSGLAALGSDPGVDSNSSIRPASPKRIDAGPLCVPTSG
jgi:hypothetical protein